MHKYDHSRGHTLGSIVPGTTYCLLDAFKVESGTVTSIKIKQIEKAHFNISMLPNLNEFGEGSYISVIL